MSGPQGMESRSRICQGTQFSQEQLQLNWSAVVWQILIGLDGDRQPRAFYPPFDLLWTHSS